MDINDFSGSDVFDSRDVQDRIEEVNEIILLQLTADEDEDTSTFSPEETVEHIRERGREDEIDETLLDELEELCDFASSVDSAEWNSGVFFIHDSYFAEYAEQMAEDIGAINRDAKWPLNHINWDEAADELRVDYESLMLDGSEFWFRA